MSGVNFNDTDNQASTGGGSSNATQSSFTSGEALTAGNALCLLLETSAGPTQSGQTNSLDIGQSATEYGGGQSFTTGAIGTNKVLDQLVISFSKSNSPSGNIVCEIYSDTGTTLLGTADNQIAETDISSSPTYSNQTFTFRNSQIALSPSTTYYFYIYADRAVNGTIFTRMAVSNANTGAYRVSDVPVWSSIAEGVDFDLQYREDKPRAYKADADDSTKLGFVGFADETVAIDTTVNVNTAGVDDNQSSLTTNSTYYLSDTAGAISTTAGTNEVAVGTALSATEIAINLFGGSGGGGSYASHAFANMTGRTAGGDHTLTSGYTNNSDDFTINSTNITCNFDGYVNVRTLISMGTLDNDTNAGLAVHKNGTDQGTSTFVTYDNDETDTFAAFPCMGEWNISVANGDTLSIRGEVLTSISTGKFIVDRVA